MSIKKFVASCSKTLEVESFDSEIEAQAWCDAKLATEYAHCGPHDLEERPHYMSRDEWIKLTAEGVD